MVVGYKHSDEVGEPSVSQWKNFTNHGRREQENPGGKFTSSLHFIDSLNVSQLSTLSESTLPETNSSHLKMDGWSTSLSFWDGLFSGAI